MLSLLDHLNRRSEPTGGLLGGYTPSREIIDRATLLPIGQYEDGSLTFAWPGFLKDAYDGAVRSAVAQEGAPLYDDGGQYVSGAQMQPLDAFNAASLGPVSGVVGRAAGAIPRGALGSGGSDMLSGAKGIRAYHGSPHDFDKFDISKIGTGEGAQAYGHGLYFAENEGVARSYRDALGSPVRQMKPARSSDEEQVQQALSQYVRDLGDGGWDDLVNLRHAVVNDIEKDRLPPSALDTFDKMVQDGWLPDTLNNGRMYEVNINAQPEQFLDWDAPLYDQGEPVRNAMEQFRTVPGAQDLWSIRGHLRTDLPGSSAVNHLAKLLGGPEHVSSKLKDAGVPGVRYRDAGSRWNGQTRYDDPTRNYVVFDDSLIDIMRKYANPPEAGLPSLLGQSQQDTQLASADPQYDAYDLLQQMRRPPPSPFWIDFQALDQQQMMDPPQMAIPPERQSPERLIPLRDKW
ncbi:hypothetical protein [Hyphomicrobium sp. DMF-1]|uniref:hypothetical protein n=1 Tax=Hyphomicrobium sp. DMF-1 TaxID=3019544 RepID=UPI0022EC0A10|nr:hypothetical protein [Hyphomicrobium sp. DMF-1]WBT40178.1 hypothetical protein PE058_09930 [Hyphomicrobium sp. DMF-1]